MIRILKPIEIQLLLSYYEILELLDGVAKRGNIVGLDLVEVAPDYDPTGSTTTLAAQILMNVIGRILHHRK